ncbi:MAG: DUF3237 domain-containing protein [Betaproteobacteria bacterium]|nr:DUF3237 domain-containing protein [Betaproteobacteria bacterium]
MNSIANSSIANRFVAGIAAVLLSCLALPLQAQTAEIKTEYLMTYQAPLDPPIAVDGTLMVVNVPAGGWVKGPKISGKFVPPGADWLRIMPSGAMRLDVRAMIQTDDNAYIYLTYNGIMQHSKESAERMAKGEVMMGKDVPYFLSAPTFQTSSEKYAWLNGVQAVNKMVELKLGPGGYVRYDVFIVR